MQGRYGADQFSKFLIITGFILFLLSNFNFVGGFIFRSLGLLLIIYSYIRLFSKNIQKRYQENQKYLYYVNRIKNYFRKEKNYRNQSKDHRIYKCPSCKQKVRVPKGKGKIEITCPKCHKKFVKRT